MVEVKEIVEVVIHGAILGRAIESPHGGGIKCKLKLAAGAIVDLIGSSRAEGERRSRGVGSAAGTIVPEGNGVELLEDDFVIAVLTQGICVLIGRQVVQRAIRSCGAGIGLKKVNVRKITVLCIAPS